MFRNTYGNKSNVNIESDPYVQQDLLPQANNQINVGSSSLRFSTVFANNLNISGSLLNSTRTYPSLAAAPTTRNANTALTASDVLAGFLWFTGGGPFTIRLPTASGLLAALPANVQSTLSTATTVFDLTILNTSGGTITFNEASGDGSNMRMYPYPITVANNVGTVLRFITDTGNATTKVWLIKFS